jgi:hypothetical protein
MPNPTLAYGINNSGDIVGKYVDTGGVHGFIATPSPPIPLPFTILLLGSSLLGLLGWGGSERVNSHLFLAIN